MIGVMRHGQRALRVWHTSGLWNHLGNRPQQGDMKVGMPCLTFTPLKQAPPECVSHIRRAADLGCNISNLPCNC